MEEKICGNCKNFRLHYIKYSRGHYVPLEYGHCVKPRLKKRIKSDKAVHIGVKNLSNILKKRYFVWLIQYRFFDFFFNNIKNINFFYLFK